MELYGEIQLFPRDMCSIFNETHLVTIKYLLPLHNNYFRKIKTIEDTTSRLCKIQKMHL